MSEHTGLLDGECGGDGLAWWVRIELEACLCQYSQVTWDRPLARPFHSSCSINL